MKTYEMILRIIAITLFFVGWIGAIFVGKDALLLVLLSAVVCFAVLKTKIGKDDA